MVNLFQMGDSMCHILIALVASLVITTFSALNMIEKKRINLFIPFFILGIGTCLLAGFMLNNFFGIAVDVFYVFCFVSVVGVFFILWRKTR